MNEDIAGNLAVDRPERHAPARYHHEVAVVHALPGGDLPRVLEKVRVLVFTPDQVWRNALPPNRP